MVPRKVVSKDFWHVNDTYGSFEIEIEDVCGGRDVLPGPYSEDVRLPTKRLILNPLLEGQSMERKPGRLGSCLWTD